MLSRRWSSLRSFRRGAAALAVGATLLLLGWPALAQNEAPAAAEAEQSDRGMAILMNMARYLGQAKGFSVNIRCGYDAIQENGERIEFGEMRRVLLQRPDRLRVEMERSDGVQGVVLFDGKEIKAFKAGANVYATVEKPGSVDDALVYLVRDLELTIPLARIYHSKLPKQFERLVQSAAYVETDALFDAPVDHITARTPGVVSQFWIAQGEFPLPRRIVLTYTDIPGQPRFWADFSEWNMAPEVSADSFVFHPPDGAEKIPFIISSRGRGTVPSTKGGKK